MKKHKYLVVLGCLVVLLLIFVMAFAPADEATEAPYDVMHFGGPESLVDTMKQQFELEEGDMVCYIVSYIAEPGEIPYFCVSNDSGFGGD